MRSGRWARPASEDFPWALDISSQVPSDFHPIDSHPFAREGLASLLHIGGSSVEPKEGKTGSKEEIQDVDTLRDGVASLLHHLSQGLLFKRVLKSRTNK